MILNFSFIKLISMITIFPIMGSAPTDINGQGSISGNQEQTGKSLTYTLPQPDTKGTMSVEETMAARRSQRNFSRDGISLKNASQLLWAAYGITKSSDHPALGGGLKTAPSAGATYPLQVYLLVRDVEGVEPGVYRYIPKDHSIVRVIDRDVKKELSAASYNQKMIEQAPACIFYSAIYSKTTGKYKERGRERYVCMDLGHSAENVFLQAVALGLGTCPVGAFNDDEVRKVMQLPVEEEPLYMMPIGIPVKRQD